MSETKERKNALFQNKFVVPKATVFYIRLPSRAAMGLNVSTHSCFAMWIVRASGLLRIDYAVSSIATQYALLNVATLIRSLKLRFQCEREDNKLQCRNFSIILDN